MGDFIPVDLGKRVSEKAARGVQKKSGRTSLRHFWLRMAYRSRVVAVSLAMVLVLRRVASLNDFEALDSSPPTAAGGR